MRTAPDLTDKYDRNDWERLNAPEWMLAALALNPAYTSWGPGEDHMTRDGDGWDSNVERASWADFDFNIDDLNVCADFHFEVTRDSRDCDTCGGEGYHPDARWIADSFYRHSSPFTVTTWQEEQARAVMARFGSRGSAKIAEGGYPDAATLARYGDAFRAFCEAMRGGDGTWADKITEDEAAVLGEAGRGRLDKLTTAEDFNAAQRARGIGHDAINRGILVRRRCERLGVPLHCPDCEGHGYIYTAPTARLSLVLWMLHPRKGASRGVTVKDIREEDVPAVRAWLAEAAKANAARFERVVAP
jgi:hypothetical protein